MRTWKDYLIAILIIVIGSLFGPIGFIVAVIIVAKLSSTIDMSIDDIPESKPTPPENLIELSWRDSDMTTVPDDMLVAYRKYLKSNEWYNLRSKCFKRDNYRCVRCGYIGDEKQAHHTSYEGIYENMNFSIDQLVCLCKDCHSEEHKSLREGRGSIL